MPDEKIYIRARAVKREGLPGYFIPQHLVPNEGAVFEVSPTEEDPEPRHPFKIGAAGHKALVEAAGADRLIIEPAKAADFDPHPAAMTLDEKVEQLMAEVKELREENRDLRRELNLQHKEDTASGRRGK